ncbi:MAG: neutral/alkaline non-lysosomal ceramidase N-terminal domain-containing protein [Flammeovirgaceae bacterium]|nr:neutral/alkaline non-lysosomal ceramidase N-terminal domain-containing protein [Flammeovirgaceae bacterium]MDW8286453.1 neutral/alkaline non-lysosomal ceramidase N-terminal domain-containing protein [Flammeovirgaceae bacterium]
MKWLKWFTQIFIFLFVVVFALFKAPQKVDYKNEAFYRKTQTCIDSIAKQVSPYEVMEWKVGWGEAAIIPSSPIDFAGYGRKGKFEFVADTTKVKTLLLLSPTVALLLVEFDLLIITPTLKHAITRAVEKRFPTIRHIYFTASHTHKSYGGWSEDIAGKLLLGGYQPEVVELLMNQTVTATEQAFSNCERAKIYYKAIQASDWVKNRLDERGYEDAYLRMIVFEKEKGQKGLLATFAAHATCLSSRFKGLSGDYPSLVAQQLMQKGYDFAMMVAGAVGSHSHTAKDGSYEALKEYAKGLADQFEKSPTDSFLLNVPQEVKFAEIPISLPEPQWRIAPRVCFRSWVFHALFAHTPKEPFITYLKLGEVVFLGMPCDFSGELYPLLNAYPHRLVVTSFNGSYTGYFSHPSRYYLNNPETRDMNWYGENASVYLVDIVNRLLERMK